MQRERTLFNYLHNALVQQIVSGKVLYGEKLPSLRSLCGIYNVGIRTVRDVINTLVEEGYVETVERSHVRVAYQTNTETSQQAKAVLAKQDAVYALLKAQSYIMPNIYGRAAKFCDDELVQQCKKDIEDIDSLSTKNKWRRSREPLQRLTSVFNNSLLQDLCVDFTLYSQIVVVTGFENPYKEMFLNAEESMNQFFDWFAEGDSESIYAIIEDMYDKAAEGLRKYFADLQSAYPMNKPEQAHYVWIAEKGRLRVHTQVMRSIIKKIRDGIYENDTYLPSSSELRREYKISSYTVGKVMESLEKAGFVKKTNIRGGYLITAQNINTDGLFIQGSAASNSDAMTFLEAVHILALISRGIAMLGFDYLDEEQKEKIVEHVEHRNALDLETSILSALVQNQPYEPLKTTFEQLVKLIDWGCYFAFAYYKEADYNVIREKSRLVVQCMNENDKVGFAEMLESIYCYVFETMREIISDLGINDAKKINL